MCVNILTAISHKDIIIREGDAIEVKKFKNFRINDMKIKTPDNPSILKQAKLITLCR